VSAPSNLCSELLIWLMWLVLHESTLSSQSHPQTLRRSGSSDLDADGEGGCWVTGNRGVGVRTTARWGGAKREAEKERKATSESIRRIGEGAR
jgi:hypothetical protein